MKDYKEAIEAIMKNTTSMVMDHAIKAYRQGYENGLGKAQTDSYVKGYEDGKADTPFTDTEEAEKRAYERGLNEAWEAAGKLYKISSDDFSKLFEMKSPYFDFSIQEVLAKIKEYEDKQKCKQTEDEIKVGYEVYNIDRDNKRIVTAIDGNKAIQLCSNGKYTVDNIDTLHWTGRPSKVTVEQMDKIAKLYELADKLNVKIGGDDNDNQRLTKLLPDKP